MNHFSFGIKRVVPSRLIPGSPIFFLGEAPGESEERAGAPFVGASGRELARMCSEVGIDFSACSVANVFTERPPNNDILEYTVTSDALPAGYNLPALERGRYLTPKVMDEFARLASEIASVRPNIIVGLGRTAILALTRNAGISSGRGILTACSLAPGYKTLSTYHPAAILREWSLRIVAIADLAKAAAESSKRELVHDTSTIWINPTIEDLTSFERLYMQGAPHIAADIETAKGVIRCIGFAPSPSHALVVPFLKHGRAYWSPSDEARAREWCRHVLHSYRIIFHNGAFDSSYCIREGMVPFGYTEDTMILHHSMYPELKKSLEFLGSVYATRPAWKNLRPRGEHTEKREQ